MCGCASTPPAICRNPSEPSTDIVINWSHFRDSNINAWIAEAKAQTGKPVCLFACHGADINGQWMTWPDAPRKSCPVESVAWTLHDLYPHHAIVLLCCNEPQIALHVPGVYYPPRSVWLTPGKNLRFCWDSQAVENDVGHFCEFWEGKP